MKVDLIRKFKWYIVGFILVAIMLSISLSFCSWDNLSVNSILKSQSGNFEVKWNDYVKDAKGNTIQINTLPKVGDIVTFGNYYQNLTNSGDIADKAPIRWIVVEKVGTKLTLLSERIMAFGSFWGTRHYSEDKFVFGSNSYRYQNYSESAVRAWLNSINTRTDGGAIINIDSANGVAFKGFLNEAFRAEEQKLILSKNISQMGGGGKENIGTSEIYASVSDKVWLPSFSEIFGTNDTVNWGKAIDGIPNSQFSYFAETSSVQENKILIAKTSQFASSKHSNFTLTGLEHEINYQSTSEGSAAWWWMRSANKNYWYDALTISILGIGNSQSTYDCYGGIRPAIDIQLQ